ncbi:MAG: beta-ketoacyl-ACP synthase II [Alphaproteobacteria bacterium]|nr:beta-ketoacyl-ACP synthase II [Alphaproteobacteria bacterium]
MRRVVITGMGMVTPLGAGVDYNWKSLLASKSGIRPIQNFDVSDLPVKIGGIIPRAETADLATKESGLFHPDNVLDSKEQRKVEDFILYAIAAADEALIDSGWKPQTEEEFCRTGVMVGSGIGGLGGIADTAITLHEKGPRRVSPFFIPSCLINLASGQISIKHGFKGPNHAVVTACSTGAHAIGDAARIIMWDDADVMLAGGAEAAVNRIGMAGFAAARALSTAYNDTPEKASRPYDSGRDGFVMGEGAGVLVLEEYEHAKKRGAKIYAEVVGYGQTGDAYDVVAPDPEGQGAIHAMQFALEDAGMEPTDVQYINAHGTSTGLGDVAESKAIEQVFGNKEDRTHVGFYLGKWLSKQQL